MDEYTQFNTLIIDYDQFENNAQLLINRIYEKYKNMFKGSSVITKRYSDNLMNGLQLEKNKYTIGNNQRVYEEKNKEKDVQIKALEEKAENLQTQIDSKPTVIYYTSSDSDPCSII